MSKIQGKPFIELVIDTLDADKKKDFLDLVNGSDKTPEFRSLINASALITGSDKNKVQYVVLETWNKTFTGYLVYNNSYCVLVAFNNNTQELQIVDIDLAKQTYRMVRQPLNILELRMYLQEASDHVTPGEIDSGEAPANAMLVADGDGSTEFVSPADGSAQYLLGLDSQGNIIKDELPEGIVVDQEIVEDSPNAVAGGAVYDALAEKADADDVYTKTQIDTALEEKANVDGNYPTMTVGAADNLTPYSEDSGDDQNEPFILQGTGCGNGTKKVDTGSLALLKEKQGNTVVVNQLNHNPNFTSLDYWNAARVNASVSNNVATITCDNDGDNYLETVTLPMVIGHKYLFLGSAKVSSVVNDDDVFLVFYGTGRNYYFTQCSNANVWTNFSTIFECQTNNYNIIRCQCSFASVTHEYKDIYLIDLTQWFGSNDNIPSDLLAHPENFFRYYQGSLAYNEGTLVNSNGRYLKTIGRNLFDKTDITSGKYVEPSDGKLYNSASNSASAFIRVVPNATYYLRTNSNESGSSWCAGYSAPSEDAYVAPIYMNLNNTTTIPSNVCYIRISLTNTYLDDYCLSIYYDGESGYDQNYPYEVLTNNDTGTEVLRSAGNVADIKLPDGTIKRNVGYVDLGTLEYYYNSSWNAFSTNINNSKRVEEGDMPNAICPRFLSVNGHASGDTQPDLTMAINTDYHDAGVCTFRDTSFNGDYSAFKTAMSGVYLFYELATPEPPEQGTPYSENIVIDDFGSMDFSGTSGVPQGNLIFYPADYKAFIDTLYNQVGGDGSNVLKKVADISEEGEEAEYESLPEGAPESLKQLLDYIDAQHAIEQANIGGALRHQLADKAEIDFNNTNVVDMGNLNWGYAGSQFYAHISDMKSSTANVLCPLYVSGYTTDKCIWAGSDINVNDSSYTDATAFKNAMKGVLLAYEKANE